LIEEDTIQLEYLMFKLSALKPLTTAFIIAVAFSATSRTQAQNLTLEGQTGGFITPTAYVVLSEKGHVWSHPAVGYHFVNASKVIGYVHTFSIEEGIASSLAIRGVSTPRETAQPSVDYGITPA
jgi:hypothetical protein